MLNVALFLVESPGLEPGGVSTSKVVNLSYYYKVSYLVLVAEFPIMKTIRPEVGLCFSKLIARLFRNYNLVTSLAYVINLIYVFLSPSDCQRYHK